MIEGYTLTYLILKFYLLSLVNFFYSEANLPLNRVNFKVHCNTAILRSRSTKTNDYLSLWAKGRPVSSTSSSPEFFSIETTLPLRLQ